MRLKTSLFAAVLLLALVAGVCAQTNIPETRLLGYTGNVWDRIERGDLIPGAKCVIFHDFMGYSNTTTGVVILAAGSTPDKDTVLTPWDWYWGTTLVNGSVKLIAGVNGTVVLDTAHGAQNDAATLAWREANFDISNNCSFEAYVKLNSLTNCIFEAGWYVDANDEALFRFNPATSSTKWLVVYENNNGGEQSTTTTVAASTSYTRLRIDLFSTGAAKFYINGVLVKTLAASAIKDVAFKPRFYAKVTDAAHVAAKTMTVDYVKIVQDR